MKVLVFGSLNIDYVYSVNHFVQPGETLLADDRQIFSGGKGLNQAIAFAKYGLETWHAGAFVPETDASGRRLCRNGPGSRKTNGRKASPFSRKNRQNTALRAAGR